MAVLGASTTNPPLLPDLLITLTRSFTVPFKVKAVVHVFGGGGSGGAGGTANGSNETGVGNMPCTTGGGAGAHAASIVELSPGVTYTATCGPGGDKQIKQGAGTGTDDLGPGNAGTDSSFSGSGITTITAKAGGAGQAAFFNASGSNNTLAGGLGGPVSGSAGTLFVFAGGAGGSIAKPVNSVVTNNHSSATGGGSVGIHNTGFRGGSITGQIDANLTNATGGAGTGGNGGDMPANNNFANRVTAGGSVYGEAGIPNANGNLYGGNFAPSWFSTTPVPLFDFDTTMSTGNTGAGGEGNLFDALNHRQICADNVQQAAGNGGSGNYYYKIGITPSYALMTGATLFAGGGADSTNSVNDQCGRAVGNAYSIAKAGGLCGGGGGGGANAASNSGTKSASGQGGHGAVYIRMLERIT